MKISHTYFFKYFSIAETNNSTWRTVIVEIDDMKKHS